MIEDEGALAWERMCAAVWEALEMWTPNQVRRGVESVIAEVAPAIIAALDEQEGTE